MNAYKPKIRRLLQIERVLLISIVATSLLVPLHGQEQSAKNAAADAPADPQASGNDRRVSEEALQELSAVKKRIAELEAKLRASEASQHSDPGKVGAAAPESFVSAAPSAQALSAQSGDPESEKKAEPFAFADWTWLNGNPRTKTAAFDSKFFTPEIRADVDYVYDFRHPKDDTISGSSEVFRANEVQMTQLGIWRRFPL